MRPLRQALSGKDAWVTGLKRSDAPTRRYAPIVSYDESWGMVKVNPLATWTHQDLVGYADDHDIPQHPLRSQGYLSIGCAPRMTQSRSGSRPRWPMILSSRCACQASKGRSRRGSSWTAVRGSRPPASWRGPPARSRPMSFRSRHPTRR